MRDEIGLPALGGSETERLEGTTLLRVIEGSADPGQRDVAKSGAERLAPERRCRAASRAWPSGGAVESRLKVLLDVHEPARESASGYVEVGGLLNGAAALLPGKVRVDDQRHPIARNDVVDLDTMLGQLRQPLTGGNQDSTEEVWIRDNLRLALALG